MDLIEQFQPWILPMSNVPAPIVIAGAGLSFGLVPMALQLAKYVSENKSSIESSLAVKSTIDPGDPSNPMKLYQWAGDCLNQLISKGNSNASAKHALADAMGVTYDARFLAKANIPLRGCTPRHRVLGRLAREGRIHAVWSFNWDCWIEAALECVGLRKGKRPGANRIAPSDWKLRYQVWVDGNHVPEAQDLLPLFKAHGCVRALHDGLGDFVISEDEMCVALSHQPPGRVERMKRDLSERWAVTVGWSATEDYVQELLVEMKSNGLLGDRVTVIDINPAQPRLERVCLSYGTTTDSAGVKVMGSELGTTDDLFLWIQVNRGFAALRHVCIAHPTLDAQLAQMEAKIPAYSSPEMLAFWPASFLDSWLPIWLRTCFMVGAQELGSAEGNLVEILPTEQRDAHIPWCCDQPSRVDLQTAASLLSHLDSVTSTSRSWNFESFPGGLWDRSKQILILPIPFWTPLSRISASSLRPLFESSHWYDKSRIRTLALLPIHLLGDEEPNANIAEALLVRWKEVLASAFNHRFLADMSNIKSITITELTAPDFWGEGRA